MMLTGCCLPNVDIDHLSPFENGCLSVVLENLGSTPLFESATQRPCVAVMYGITSGSLLTGFIAADIFLVAESSGD